MKTIKVEAKQMLQRAELKNVLGGNQNENFYATCKNGHMMLVEDCEDGADAGCEGVNSTVAICA